MTPRYNKTAAMHYAAYRPPLHQLILKRALVETENFPNGLDVGCGTGRSSIALVDYCKRVYAIDPSKCMLEAATPHDAITYMQGSAEEIPLPDQSIDVATFAGSLFYADMDTAHQDVCRVCRCGAPVIPYDFEVLLEDVLQLFGIAESGATATYNHSANFSGMSAFREMHSMNEHIQFDISVANLAHILLADSGRHDAFSERYKTTSPHGQLVEDLGPRERSITMDAHIYYSVYRTVADSSGR